MSDELLIENIKALLHLNASNSLVPHGIGNHARDLLDASITSIDRLRAEVVRIREAHVTTTQRARIAEAERDRHKHECAAITQQLAAANERIKELEEEVAKWSRNAWE